MVKRRERGEGMKFEGRRVGEEMIQVGIRVVIERGMYVVEIV